MLLNSIMGKIKCGTSRCSNAIAHYHIVEERYYCEHCVLVVCNTNECKPSAVSKPLTYWRASDKTF